MEFLNLKQGKMSLVEYNIKFMELCCYAPHIVSTESRKARKFEDGQLWNIQNKSGLIKTPNPSRSFSKSDNCLKIIK